MNQFEDVVISTLKTMSEKYYVQWDQHQYRWLRVCKQNETVDIWRWEVNDAATCGHGSLYRLISNKVKELEQKEQVYKHKEEMILGSNYTVINGFFVAKDQPHRLRDPFLHYP